MSAVMAQSGGNSNRPQRRLIAFPAAVLLIYAAYNLFLNPMGVRWGPNQWLAPLLFSVMFAQPVLFAEWAAFGPGATVRRIPLTVVVATAVASCGYYTKWNVFTVSSPTRWDEVNIYLYMWAATFFIAVALLLVARKLTGWRILHPGAASPDLTSMNQFGVKYLLTLTGLFALVLGMARLLASQHLSEIFHIRFSDTSRMFLGMSLVLLAILPTFTAPSIVLSPRPTLRMLISVPLAWVALSWLALEAVMATTSSHDRLRIARDIALLQAGAALTGIVSALLVRIAGYRLLRVTKSNPVPHDLIE